MRFPIRTKLLLLMSALVVAAILAYLFLAIKLFKEDKTVLVYELNAANVRTLSAELKAELLKTADKVKLLTSGYREDAWVRAVLQSEDDLVSYALFGREAGSGRWVRRASVIRDAYLKLQGEDRREYEESRAILPFPADDVLKAGASVTRSLLPGGSPVLTMALSLKLGASAAPAIAVVDLRVDHVLERLRKGTVATVYVVNQDGDVVVHPDPEVLRKGGSLTEIPVVVKAVNSKFGLELERFEYGGEGWLGAHADVGFAGLRVISQTREDEAFLAANRLISKSVLFGLFIVTVALLLSSRLASTLTDPLHELVSATERVARWDFSEPIKVKTNDEVAQLASAFNSMSLDLRTQREQIDRHQAELEQKVKERTAELEWQKKKAAEANEALVRTTRLASLGEMAGIAAHEVLNPVNNMGIRVEKMKNLALQAEPKDFSLLGEILDAWQKSYKDGGWAGLKAGLEKPAEGGKTMLEEDLENLGGIARDLRDRVKQKEGDFGFLSQEITRITKIINNMRSLSRVTAERKEMEIHVPIEDTLHAFSDLFEREKVKVAFDKATSAARAEGRVLADKDELVQVFSNLLRNGMQAVLSAREKDQDPAKAAARGVRVRVSATEKHVEVRVEDDGTGIRDADRDRIFEPHFTTKSAEEGTGLGLSISRRLVRAFDGDIEIERTEPGVGTIFRVRLPRA